MRQERWDGVRKGHTIETAHWENAKHVFTQHPCRGQLVPPLPYLVRESSNKTSGTLCEGNSHEIHTKHPIYMHSLPPPHPHEPRWELVLLCGRSIHVGGT